MPDIGLKCKTLIYTRLRKSSKQRGSVTAALMRHWRLSDPLPNPPQASRFSTNIAHFRHYAIDMAYITPPGATETDKTFKRRTYSVLKTITQPKNATTEMRITRKYPDTEWERVWKNLHTADVPEAVKSQWYQVIHDILPTNERMAAIGLTPTAACAQCGNPDSQLHRITACGEGPVIWHWTRARIAAILRMDPRYIPAQWTVRPDFQHWPPQRHQAILWILAHLMSYQLQTTRPLSLLDYMDFLRRARWKKYNRTPRRNKTGRYLEVL